MLIFFSISRYVCEGYCKTYLTRNHKTLDRNIFLVKKKKVESVFLFPNAVNLLSQPIKNLPYKTQSFENQNSKKD